MKSADKDQPNPWITDAVFRANQLDRAPNQLLFRLIVWLYRLKKCRKQVIRIALKIEGGEFYSRIIRKILSEYYNVDVGLYSYGPILNPGVLPKGSKVGRYCSVGQDLIVRRRNHPTERLCQHPFFYNSALGYLRYDTIPKEADNPFTIGHDVWIGDRVTVVPGCSNIGDGAIVAAGSVLTHDVPAYAVVGGIPAKKIRDRFPAPAQNCLQKSKWWELSIAELMQQRNILIDEINIDTLLESAEFKSMITKKTDS